MYVFALIDALAGWNGGQVTVRRGEVWDAEDPFVAAHQDWFNATPPKLRNTTGKPSPTPVVEEKTRKAPRR